MARLLRIRCRSTLYTSLRLGSGRRWVTSFPRAKRTCFTPSYEIVFICGAFVALCSHELDFRGRYARCSHAPMVAEVEKRNLLGGGGGHRVLTFQTRMNAFERRWWHWVTDDTTFRVFLTVVPRQESRGQQAATFLWFVLNSIASCTPALSELFLFPPAPPPRSPPLPPHAPKFGSKNRLYTYTPTHPPAHRS